MTDKTVEEKAAQTIEAIQVAFSEIEDPRREHGRLYPLAEVLFLGVVGILCGGDGWVGVAQVCSWIEPWLRRFTPLEEGVPSHDTFGRVFSLLEPEVLVEALTAVTRALISAVQGSQVALDGKASRRSFVDGDRNTALYTVTAWATEFGVALGCKAVQSKTNEQTAMLALVELLDLAGKLVTIDAQGCQKKIARALTNKNADYVLALKDNHPTAHQEAQDFFETLVRADGTADCPSFSETDAGHGRVEERRYYLTSDINWFEDLALWPGLTSFGMVESTRHIKGESTTTCRYFLVSLPESEVKVFAQAVRRHWAIENELHWVLDIGFREDEQRIRTGHAAANLAAMNRLAVSAVRKDKGYKVGAKIKRQRAAVDEAYREKLLALLAAAA